MFDAGQGSLGFLAERRAAWNPSHLASQRLKFSAVAANGQFLDLLTGKVGSIISGSPVFKMDGVIGPCFNFPAASGLTFSNGKDNTTYGGRLFGAIFRLDSVSTNQYIVANSAANGGNSLYVDNTGVLSCGGFGVANKASTLAVAVNVPYFAAVSQDGTTTTHFVLKNLSTGVTKVDINASGITPNAQSGGYNVGFSNNNNSPALGSIAAVMYGATFLPNSQLSHWARDPWEFWYPT